MFFASASGIATNTSLVAEARLMVMPLTFTVVASISVPLLLSVNFTIACWFSKSAAVSSIVMLPSSDMDATVTVAVA